MKKSLLVFALLVIGATWIIPTAHAQFQAPTSLQGKNIVIPAGTTFEGRIDTTIGSSISKSGQSFKITLSTPMIANGSDVLVPAGATVLGEVVEAVPGSKVPRQKGEPKPIGKLRIQLHTMQMPDGMSYPLVANIVPDKRGQDPMGRGRMAGSRPMGAGVAYIGTQANFEAVAPGAPKYIAPNRWSRGGSTMASPGAVMRDPVMGRDPGYVGSGFYQGGEIRCLVHRHHDLYVYSGSPVTLQLTAPFKLTVAAAPASPALLQPAPAVNPEEAEGHRRFIKDNPSADAQNTNSANTGGVNQSTNIPKKNRDSNDSQF